MSLHSSTEALLAQLDAQIADLRDVAELRALRGEELRYDSVAQRVTRQTRHGEITGRWYAELIGTYHVRDRFFRWGWAGGNASYVTFIERVFREGQLRDAPQLSMSVVGDLTREEADTLATLGVVLASGRDVYVEEADGAVRYMGMFDAARPSAMQLSVPPPAVAPKTPTDPPRGAQRSIPPSTAARVSTPPGGRHVEPSRETFLPVAKLTHEILARDAPGFSQAVLAITVDAAAARPRLMVHIAVVDGGGKLRSVDASRALLDAALDLLTHERGRGEGRWRKLEAHIVQKKNGGATLHVEVV